MRISNSCAILFALFTLFSCEVNDAEPVSLKEDLGDWILLKIPNGREAYAISGSIDDVLIVTTHTKVYRTEDSGKTWKEGADFQGPMPGLIERNDSLFILAGHSQFENYEYASVCNHFSTDKGLTWQRDIEGIYSRLEVKIKYVQADLGIQYKIKNNTSKIGNSVTSYINPSDIEKITNNGSDKLRIPFDYILNNLHLDDKNRLYVAASNGTVNEDRTVTSVGEGSPALVFISKNPLP